MKRHFSLKKLYILLFIATLTLPWLLWGIVALFDADFYKEQSDVSIENRERNTFKISSLMDSGDELSAFIDDCVPFRRFLIDLYQKYTGKLEKAYQNTYREVSIFLQGGHSTVSEELTDFDEFNESTASTYDTASEDPLINEENTEPEETVPGHEHNYVVIESTPATCEKSGVEIYECECGSRYTKALPPAEHSWILLEESTVSYLTYGYKKYICTLCAKVEYKDFVAKYIDTSYMAPQIINDTTLLGRFDWMFYAGEANLEYYKGTNLYDSETLASFAEKINRLQALCDERSIKLSISIFPNKEHVYPEYLPTLEVSSETKREKALLDYLSLTTDTTIIYPLDTLISAKVYWPVYYKYDTHWNHMGAFIALQSMYKAVGLDTTNPINASVYSDYTSRNDLLYLAGLSRENYGEDYDYRVDYKPEVYSDYNEIEGSEPLITRSVSTAGNELRAVITGDSYKNLMAYYLSKDFTYTTIADKGSLNDVAKDILNADYLFVTSVERYDNKLFDSIDTLIQILESGKQ